MNPAGFEAQRDQLYGGIWEEPPPGSMSPGLGYKLDKMSFLVKARSEKCHGESKGREREKDERMNGQRIKNSLDRGNRRHPNFK